MQRSMRVSGLPFRASVASVNGSPVEALQARCFFLWPAHEDDAVSLVATQKLEALGDPRIEAGLDVSGDLARNVLAPA